MKVAYIQSVGGASGDMLLGALLDAGLPLDAIHEAIGALDVPGVEMTAAERSAAKSAAPAPWWTYPPRRATRPSRCSNP